MSHHCNRSRLACTALVATLVLGFGLGGPASAGDTTPFLYALNERGRVSMGGTLVEILFGSFDPNDPNKPKGEHRWVDLSVDGSERWALRLDGRIVLNGVLAYELPWEITGIRYIWQRLHAANGGVYAIRADGLLAIDGVVTADYPFETSKDRRHYFEDVLALVAPASDGSMALSLRSDGAIFGTDPEVPLLQLIGKQNEDPLPCNSNDGDGSRRRWIRLAQDPLTSMVFALRHDGRVNQFDPADPVGSSATVSGDCAPPGLAVVKLPFPEGSFRRRDLYRDLTTREGGGWYVVRRDGRIYTSDNDTMKIVDLPGTGRQSSSYQSIVAWEDTFYSMRRSGQVYESTVTPRAFRFPWRRLVRMSASAVPPDLTGLDPVRPELSTYTPRIVSGDLLVVPVVTSDVDTPDADLLVSVDLSALPGASYDAATRTVTWPSPAASKGMFKFPVTVDDGASDPVTMTTTVHLSQPDTSAKNKAPLVSKLSRVQVLVGLETTFLILTADPEGDPVTVSVDPEQEPFVNGATFDPVTNTFAWTPGLSDVKTHTAVFQLTDGDRTVKQKVKIDVVSPLY